MDLSPTRLCSAFDGKTRIASGPLLEVAAAVKQQLGDAAISSLILDNITSEVIEIDFRGDSGAVAARLTNDSGTVEDDTSKPRGRGRPKLGVVAKEVTLLPKHWDWLKQQRGGASVALRKLVTDAQRNSQEKDLQQRAQTAIYRFMTILASDQQEYEEALRALYTGDAARFSNLIQNWPKDIKTHIEMLVTNAF